MAKETFETDARVLAAYAANLARGCTLERWEVGHLADVVRPFGMTLDVEAVMALQAARVRDARDADRWRSIGAPPATRGLGARLCAAGGTVLERASRAVMLRLRGRGRA